MSADIVFHALPPSVLLSASPAALTNGWRHAHLWVALVAYGLMALAVLHALLMAALDRRLHRPSPSAARRFARLFDALPPLLLQERWLFRVITAGFVLLTAAVLTGALAAQAAWGRWLPFDHKTVFTLLSWLTFGALLAGRKLRGWRGRLALRWTLSGFAFLFLAYTGTRFVLAVILQRP